jgi:DNA-binding MarR family transcriptional regulator
MLIRQMMSRISTSSHNASKRFGFTSAQIRVLHTLLGSGPMSAASIAYLLGVTPSNLTGIVDRLESKGLLTRIRREDDRRVLLLTLTNEGVAQAQHIPDPIREHVAASLAPLDDEEAAQLVASLERLVMLLEQADPVHSQDVPD